MKIHQNQVVSLHYRLNEDNAEGELLEETYDGEPMAFIFGTGMMLPAFESHLENKEVGESLTFVLEPEHAYGYYEEEAVIDIPIGNFLDDEGNLDTDKVKAGAPISMHDQEGRAYHGVVEEVKEEAVVVDFNHPMSGRTLHFSVEIMEVRPATESELDHGHVHHNGEDHH